jgi:CRP-like cAMP-binding protein
VADVVLREFQTRSVFPRIARAVRELPLVGGLDAEQIHRLAGVCTVAAFESGEVIFRQGEVGREMYVVI